MADIASLGIKVTSEGIPQAEQQLGQLAKTGATTEKQVQKLAGETAKVAPAMDKASKSARELQAATRGLPAQFTDIVTSLASGQQPLQVLFQQGGQLKDMFGGTGAAAQALGGYVAGLVNPLTVAAAATIGLALAWKTGADEAIAFNQALIVTGGQAGVTSGELQDMAAAIGATVGSQRVAAAALVEVTRSAKFTGEQIGLVAQAAIDMERAVGQSLETTVKQFAKLKDDPVAAVLELNDKYGFLTESVYEQIKALDAQGNAQAAVDLAMAESARAAERMATETSKNLGVLETAWQDVRRAARTYLDLLLEIGRAPSPNERIGELTAEINELSRPGRSLFSSASKVEELKRERQRLIREQTAEYKASALKAAEDRAVADRAASDAEVKRYATTEEKRAADRIRISGEYATRIANARRDQNTELVKKLEADERKVLAAIDAQGVKKPARAARTRTPRGLSAGEDGTSLLGQLRQQIELNRAAAASEDALSVSQRLAVTARLQLEKISKNLTAARRTEVDALLAELKASDDLARSRKEEIKLAEDLARANNEITASRLNQQRANEADVLALTNGRRALEQARRRLDIEREYQDALRGLRDRGVAEDSESYRQQVALFRASRDEQLAIEASHQQKMDARRADWTNGARAALEDYRDAAADVAGQTYDLFANAMSGLEDVLVDFFTKGKADWKGFFDSIAADITRMIVRQQLSKLVQKFLPGLNGGEGDQAQALTGAAGALAASAGPLLGAATALSVSAAALAAAGAGSAAAGAAGSAGASAGGGWMSLFGALLGGGRAIGGPVSAGSLYEVGERNRPELLRMHGKQYLIPGNRGEVQPIAGRSGGGAPIFNQTFVVQGSPSRETREQSAREVGRETGRAMRRNS